MKIQQETHPFRVITIKLERQGEAKAFFDLIDKLEAFRVSSDCGIKPTDFSPDEIAVIISLSNNYKDLVV